MLERVGSGIGSSIGISVGNDGSSVTQRLHRPAMHAVTAEEPARGISTLVQSLRRWRICFCAAWMMLMLACLFRWRRSSLPICAPEHKWRRQQLSLRALDHVDFEWLRSRFGHLAVYAAESSRLREDTTDMRDGGLSEKQQTMSRFLDDIESGRDDLRHNYLKLADPYTHLRLSTGPVDGLEQLMPFGQAATTILRASLEAAGVEPPANLSFSLWIGGRGSTTALHVDDQAFNVLLVLRGAKRIVTVDDDDTSFRCATLPRNDRACWAGVDVLSSPLPRVVAGMREVTLRAGEALMIPEGCWHSVENLEPTIAVGVNEMAQTTCVGARFARLKRRSLYGFR